jgi:pimeloyl-ACP methyl ester carboxylesterase
MTLSQIYFREAGSGPPLLLIHGLMITGEMFEPVVHQLAQSHRVIVPDLRGHGRSKDVPPPYTCDRLAADLVQLLDRCGIESADVLGYSSGGAVAQQLVLDHPQRCHRLVLACTYAYNMASLREKVEGRLVPFFIRAMGIRRFAKLVLSQGLKQVAKDRADWVTGMIGSQDERLMIEAWKAAIAFDSRSRLSEIKCPTLIIAGSADKGIPLHHAHMLHDGISGSKLVIMEGADHALLWSHPEEFARVTNTFLAG